MRLSPVKRWTFGVLISLSLVALAVAAHAAPPAESKGNGAGKTASRPSEAPPATSKVPLRRGPLIDPDGR